MSLVCMVLYKTGRTPLHFHSGELHKFYCKPCLEEITRKEGGKSGDVFHLTMHRSEAESVYRETEMIL